MAARSVPFEVLDVDEVRRRYPQLALPEGTSALFQERTAIVPAARGTAAMQRRAVAHGAVLRDRSPVAGDRAPRRRRRPRARRRHGVLRGPRRRDRRRVDPALLAPLG